LQFALRHIDKQYVLSNNVSSYFLLRPEFCRWVSATGGINDYERKIILLPRSSQVALTGCLDPVVNKNTGALYKKGKP
jgi:hypothetical protein